MPQERGTAVWFFPSLSSTCFHFRGPHLQNSSGTRKAAQGSQRGFQLGMKSHCKPTKQFFYLLSNEGSYTLFHFQRHLCLNRNTKISQQSQTILCEAHSCTALMPDCLPWLPSAVTISESGNLPRKLREKNCKIVGLFPLMYLAASLYVL